MKTLNQKGAINILLIPLILCIVFLLASVGFGLWAYSSRQDYKDNVDEKIATAVEIAQQQTATEKDNEFIEREKQPLQENAGPSSYGSVKIKYPKTWSAYVDQNDRSNTPIDGYFHPTTVPGVKSDSSFALRLQVVNSTFDEQAKKFDSDVKTGKTKAKPYVPVNIDGAVGLQFDGELEDQKQGTLVMIKMRDKTLKIWTEADQFRKDMFDNVLANLTFSL